MPLLHSLVESAAARTPHATALIAGGAVVSYEQLDRRANIVARRLVKLGVRPETAVAVQVARSAELVIALLATLKAGGVCVPVEPGFPPRRRAMVRDLSGAAVLVTTSAFSHEGDRILRIDQRIDEPDTALAAPLRDTNLAYITFTSGSSGTPKAVATTHGSASTYLEYLVHAGYLSAADTVLQLAPPSFDASIRDILGPLTCGATVVLVPDEMVHDSDVLRRGLVRHGVTCVLSLVPATLRRLSEPHWPDDLPQPRLRRVLVSGEVLPAETVQQARHRFGADLAVVNHYGPTECTMTSTFHEVREEDSDPLPVGVAPEWARIHLLDELLRPVADGEVGEVYISGAGLARGYLGRPGLTATRFVANPFDAGARMYRTGDLGRLRSDGVVEFHGRADAQVKINGVRVEPGEVEAVLLRHPDVVDVAVASAPGLQGSVLVAYVTGPSAEPAHVRDFARLELPEVLVPKVIQHLTVIPRTHTGKVDRTRLPSPAVDASGSPEASTAEEAAMLRLWRAELKQPDLGVHDDLFACGGDSIVVMSLVSRIRREFGRSPAITDLFREPTVAAATRLLPDVSEHGEDDLGGRVRDQSMLSFAQERLWFFEKLLPGSALNTITAAFRVLGVLDGQALAAAVDDVIAQHESLGATFVFEDGRPQCRFTDAARGGAFEAVESGDPKALARQSLDVEHGPLFHVAWFSGTVLLVRVHHLIADARSLEIILTDLAAAYRARRNGSRPALAPRPMGYADYVAWERSWLTETRRAEHLAFWRAELQTAPPLLDLPVDRPRPMVQRYRGAVVRRKIETGPATALARAESATLFMVLLMSWATLLSRYCGQDNLVVGVPVTGRSRTDLVDVVGLFLNTLPVRIDLSGRPTFRQALVHVRDALLRALEHRAFPFEQLVEQLRPERNLSHSPVFQTLADLQHSTVPELGDADLIPYEVDNGTARFDISVSFVQQDNELLAVYTYNSDLFDAATVEDMADHFDLLVRAGAAEPDTPVDRIRLSQEFVPALHRASIRPAVAHQIAAQIDKNPDRTAVTCETACLTYAELGRLSTAIATHLAEMGIGPGAVVAVCIGRSTDLVAALVGVHYAGAAYLPLDPTHPVERLAALINDAEPDVLLTTREVLSWLHGRLPADLSVATIGDLTTTGSTTKTAPPKVVRSDDLAYVIYTSGSTGRPKGVEITHHGLAHVVHEVAGRLAVTSQDTLVAVTTVSFDIAALELFLPLTTGARLVIAPQDVAADPTQLRRLLHTEAATLLQATPTTWQLLTELDGLPPLRAALCGGEPLLPSLAGKLAEVAEQAFNMYGPTETTIWSTMTPIVADRPVSIGDPIGETTVQVLDEQLVPVPVGVAGEICLGGPGLARGYRGQPGLTATKFSAAPGGRLYRTGDRGRRGRDGRLEFLGRVDRQVKLRGFRIEPAEVERVLLAHPGVRRAVVAVRPDSLGEPQLVGYVVTADSPDLIGFLTERLPRYLVPSAIVELDELPLTANGKVDVRALPAARPTPNPASQPPATETEQVLAAIWASVLGMEQIGADDDFFAVGGHSLRAIQVIGRVNESFGVRLPLYALFSEPTVHRLALVVEEEIITQVLAEEAANS